MPGDEQCGGRLDMAHATALATLKIKDPKAVLATFCAKTGTTTCLAPSAGNPGGPLPK